MVAKLSLVFLVFFVFFQTFNASIVRRDTSTTEKNDLEDALNSIKQGLDEFVSKIQTSEMFQNATKLFDEFGQKVKQHGDELVQKFKNSTSSSTTR
ncbi:hypothetical protein ABEB36_007895 [Hypothenemus hampei]|uniref:Secreted protein n=1 Tax=Hypothenemus hampei TaxID=57062 RepID=A0ABD1EVL6_HYPHA